MKTLITKTLLTLLLFAAMKIANAQTTHYVKPVGSGIGNGSSWANASNNLQAMINISGTGDQIWVANGTYKPTADLNGDTNPADARTKTFVMKNDVTIYGGFVGTETQLSARNWKTNVTILSGDFSSNDVISGSGSTLSITNNSENAYHLVYNNDNGLTSSAVLDGFTIKGGNAVDYGGGMYNYNSSPTITNCIFSGNAGTFEAGGMFNFLASPIITNCSFTNNRSFEGGAMYNYNSSYPIITNCSFSGNYGTSGGGIFNHASTPTITNCIVWNNNTGVAGPAAVTYSIVQDDYIGTGNLNVDPLFVDAANGNLRLQVCSPAINTGIISANSTTKDLDGNSRKVGIIDMGAYEYQGTNSVNWVLDADRDGHYTGGLVSQCSSPGTGYIIKTTEQPLDCDDNDNTKWRFGSFYIDNDNDGYGVGGAISVCYGTNTPTGYVATPLGTDCNDTDPNAHAIQTWYLDADNDGHYINSSPSCFSPGAGYTTTATISGDCDDNDANKWRTTAFYVDADGDGYTSSIAPSVCYGATIPTGYAATSLGNDCNDHDAAATIARNWYLDADNDGHYLSSQQSCSSPGVGYNTTATQSGDCDDNDATRWQNTTIFLDADGDRYVVAGSQIVACIGATAPVGYITSSLILGTDCNDNDNTKWNSSLMYVDADGDGYTVGTLISVCYGATIPTGYKLSSLGSDCNDNDNTKWNSSLMYVDADGDGYTLGSATSFCYGVTIPTGYRLSSLGSDCNDSDPNIHGAQTWYLDADNDGHYRSSQSSCTSPGAGYNTTATQPGDCNDNDAVIWRNGQLAMDADGDGYTLGPLAAVCYGATIPTGYVATSLGTDCDDNDPSRWRSAFVYIDNDNDGYDNGTTTLCYGTTIPPGYKTGTSGSDCDDNDATKWRSSRLYVDADGDGYTPGPGIMVCYGTTIPTGYITSSPGTDCDDADAALNPLTKWYLDVDGDQYGTGVFLTECDRPDNGYLASELAATSGDCNDANPAINPITQWYLDADNDGYYTGAGVTACTSPGAGYKYTGVQPGDCNDSNPLVNPGATEICGNGIDDNCDGTADEDCPTHTYFVDADDDGYGTTESITTTLSTPPSYYATLSGDCNDDDASVNPGATEVCGNGIDDNCNGVIDECITYWLDGDGDGYGRSTSSITILNSSAPPSGYAPLNGDCDDGNTSVHPGATEICGNGIDDNCNGEIDECTTYWLDDDGDGYGKLNSQITILNSSAPPSGYVLLNGDCDDGNTSVHPGATEICGNGIDDNCNGEIDECTTYTYFFDGDGDGYGKDDVTMVTFEITPPLNYVAIAGDCNDEDASVHPGATEICGNGVDDNCDGVIDDGCPVYTYYFDSDDDGYGGDYSESSTNPIPKLRFVAIGGDCNDDDISVHPGATETCNGIDDNCDGVVDEGCATYFYYRDEDGDGYGRDNLEPHWSATVPPGFSVISGDCNDYNNAIHPGAIEKCNFVDDNCDGVIDEGCVRDQLPDFTKTDIYGVTHHLYGDLTAGKAVVIEVSTGWCPFSQVVEPQISHVYDDICQGQGNIKLYDIIYENETIGYDADDAYGLAYANHHNATYPVIANSRDVYDDLYYQYTFAGIPSFLVIIPNPNDPAKSTVYVITGAIDNLTDSIEDILTSHGYSITPPPSLSITITGNVCDLPSPVTLTSNQPSGNVWSTGETTKSITITAPGVYSLSYAAGCGTITKKVYIAPKTIVTTTLSSSSTTACAGKGIIFLTYDGTHPDAVLESSIDGTNWNTALDNFQGQRAVFNEWIAGTTVRFRVKEKVPNSIGLPDCEAYSNVVQVLIQQMTEPALEITASGDPCFPSTLTSSYSENNIWSDGRETQSITIHSPDYYYVVNSAGCGYIYDDITVNGRPTWYRDADADGYGDGTNATEACDQPDGYVPDGTDCNDADASVHPGATEICDGLDNNCDGQADEGFTKTTYYQDADADGFGNASVSINACSKPAGYVINKRDCDDTKASVHPGAPEICDGIDNDCDGLVDEGFTKVTYYRDADGDGYGDPVVFIKSCYVPAGYVTNKQDCNDDNAAIYPGATEICDGIDNDCDGLVDEGFTKVTYYRDADGDGYGDPTVFVKSCSVPVGYVTIKKDCNDGNAAIHPGALEIYDGIDNNCNGFIDENCAALTISDISIVEGNRNQKAMTFVVKLSKKSTQTITVDYVTQDIIAVAGSDYIVKSGTVTFLPGIVKQNVAILIIGDKSVEPDETFNVVLSNAVNAPINKTTGTGTIVNDDGNISSALAIAIPMEKRSIALTPNPASNMVKVNLQGYTGNITIQLRGIEGKLLKEEKTVATQAKFIQLQMDVSNYTGGAYLITVFDEKGNRQTAKLIVQH